MDKIDQVAVQLGKRPGDVSGLDLMKAGVPAAEAVRLVMDRAQQQTQGQAPSAPKATPPPGWSYTPTPTQPAIDLGKKLLPQIPVPASPPPPNVTNRGGGGGSFVPVATVPPAAAVPAPLPMPPAAAVPAAPPMPTVQPSLTPGQPGGINPFVWLGVGLVALLVLTRR